MKRNENLNDFSDEPIKITKKKIDDKINIEIDENYPIHEEEFENDNYVSVSVVIRRFFKMFLITFVVIAVLVAGVVYLYNLRYGEKEEETTTVSENEERDVVLTWSDSELIIRSQFNDSQDIAYRAFFGKKAKYGFELYDMVLLSNLTQRSKTPENTEKFADLRNSVNLFSYEGDTSATPTKDNWSFGTNINVEKHSLTSKDIGSIFKDRNSNEYIVVRITDEDNFVVYPHFESLSDDAYSFKLPLSPLTLVSGESTKKRIGFYTNNLKQVNIALSGKESECKIVANGKQIDTTVVEDYVQCSSVKVKITYDIPNIDSCLKNLVKNAGKNNNDSLFTSSNQKYITVNFEYCFTRNGACTLQQEIYCYRDVKINSLNTITLPIYKNNDKSFVYIPGAKSFSKVASMPENDTQLTSKSWTQENKSPYRFYTFSDEKLSKGMCVGFNCFVESAKDVKVSDMQESVCLLDSEKGCISPQLISKNTVLNKNTNYKFVSYIIPVQNKSNTFNDEDLSSLCWYWHDDEIYLMIDSNKKIDKNIVLPEYMIGKRIEVLDIMNVQINQTRLNENSLKIKTDSDNAYVVLRLSK